MDPYTNLPRARSDKMHRHKHLDGTDSPTFDPQRSTNISEITPKSHCFLAHKKH